MASPDQARKMHQASGSHHARIRQVAVREEDRAASDALARRGKEKKGSLRKLPHHGCIRSGKKKRKVPFD